MTTKHVKLKSQWLSFLHSKNHWKLCKTQHLEFGPQWINLLVKWHFLPIFFNLKNRLMVLMCNIALTLMRNLSLPPKIGVEIGVNDLKTFPCEDY